MIPSPEQIALILAQMRKRGVATVEAAGPGWSFRLALPAEPTVIPAAQDPHRPAAIFATSPGVGILLRQHPMHDNPMAIDGQDVAEGDILALVAAGPLYRPVISPVAGRLLACPVQPGQLVDFGFPLFQIAPAPSPSEKQS